MSIKVFNREVIHRMVYSIILLVFGYILSFHSVYAFDLVVTKDDYSCGADNNCSTTTDNSLEYVRKSELINYDIEFQNSGTDNASGIYLTDLIPNGTCYVVNSIEATLPAGLTILYSNDGVPTFPTGGSAIVPVANGNGVDCTITAFKITRDDPLAPVLQSYIETTQAQFVGKKNNTVITTDGKVKLQIPATFTQTQISAGNTGFTSATEVVDIDGDGDFDIVGAGVNAPTFVYKQTAPATFTATQISTGNTTFIGAPTIVDVDANGKLDIVLGGDDFGTYIYFQQLNGSFTQTQISTGNTKFRSKLKVIDVDADGRLDVVGGGYGGNTTIFFRESNGSFTTLNISGAPTNFRGGIEVEDLDGDGDIDIAGGGYFGKTYLYRKTGTRTFTEIAISASNNNYEGGLVINDIDNDGDKDIIGGGFFGDSFVYVQDVSDNFIENLLPDGNTRFFSKPIVLDADSDGDKDIIGGGYGRPTYMFEQTSPGSFARNQISSVNTFFYSGLKAVDIDNDTDTDLIGVGFNSHSYLYLNNNDGTFDESRITTVIANFIGNIEVQDINGDSFLDVIGGSDAGKSYMLVNDGQQNFTQIEISSGNTFFKGGVKVADIEADGDKDVIGGGDGGPTYVFYNTSTFNNNGTYSTIINPGGNVTTWSNIGLTETKPAGTNILYEIKDTNGTACGSTTLKASAAAVGSTIDLSSISNTYDSICLIANLITSDTTKTPILDSISVNYTVNASQSFGVEVRTKDNIKALGIGNISNTINIFPTAGDTNAANNTDTTTLTVVNTTDADLQIEKSSTGCGPDNDCAAIDDNDDDKVDENEIIRYTVEFENLGKDASEKTEIIEYIPLKTCYVVGTLEAAIPSDFPTYTIGYSNDNKVTWTYTPSAGGNGTDCNVTHFKITIKELYRPDGDFTDFDPITDGLIGYWPMDERSGSTTYNAKDDGLGTTSSGGDPRFDGNISGATWVADGSCIKGSCLSFDGVDDTITANTTFGLGTANVSMAAWVNLDSTSEHGAFLKVGSNVGSCTGYGMGVGSTTFENNGNDLILVYDCVAWFDTNIPIGTGWHHVAMLVNPVGYTTAYIDGKLVYTAGALTPISPSGSTTSSIGGYSAAARYVDATIDEVRIYNKFLSATDVYNLYENAGRSILTTTTLADNRFTSDLKLHLKLDDASGTTAIDASGYGNTGTLINGLGTTGWTTGKSKGALVFDNTNDRIEINDNDILDATVKDYSWMYWVKVPVNIAGGNGSEEYILSKYPTGTDEPRFSSAVNKSNGKLDFVIEGSTNNDDSSVTSTQDMRDNTWHHVALIRSSTEQKLKLYIDGVLNNANTDEGQNGSNAGKIIIGDYSRVPADGRAFSGTLDDIRYYEKALDGEEILNIYKFGSGLEDSTATLDNELFRSSFDDVPIKYGSGSVIINGTNQKIKNNNSNNIFAITGEINLDGVDDYLTGGSLNISNSVDVDAIIRPREVNIQTFKTTDLSNGLIAHWKFDETAGPSIDSTGNGYSATWLDNTSAVVGKYGTSLNLDGTGDYATVSSSINSQINNTITVSAWVKANGSAFTTHNVILGEAYMGDGNIRFSFGGGFSGGSTTKIGAGLYDGVAWRNASQTGTFTFGQWVHVAATYDGATIKLYLNGVLDNSFAYAGGLPVGTEEWRIGRRHDIADYWNGMIDDLRLYNRPLSALEISALYTTTPPPVAHYSLDEGQGISSLYDTTGKGNHLIMRSFTSGSWVGGRNNGSALDLNGTNQFAYLSPPNASLKPAQLTVSAWVKGDTYVSSGNKRAYIVSEQPRNAWAAGRGYNLSADGGFAKFWIGNAGGSWITATGSTSLVAGTWYHLAGTYDGTALRVYVNGVLDGTTNTTATINYTDDGTGGPTAQTFYIGTAHDTNNTSNITTANMYFFDGIIDDVKVYNYAKTAAQIQMDDVGMAQPSLDSMYSGLVGHYKLDSNGANSASTAAPGTANGNLNFTSTGKIDNAGTFDGTGDFLSTTATTFQKSQVVTRSFWIKPTANNSAIYNYIAANDGAGLDQSSSVHIRSWAYIDGSGFLQSQLLTYSCSSGGGSFGEIGLGRTSAKTIPLNKWTHVTQVFDFGSSGTVSHKLYINGALDSESSQSGVCTGADHNYLMLGWKKYNANDFSGQIDDFRIYNRALSNIEIKTLYQVEATGGTIASKGNNFDFNVTATQKNGSADNYANRTAFTTNAITTQLSGTNINDIYFYDTTKDRNYGDGSASDPLVWRVNAARSWYSETIDATYTGCNITTNDRCGNQAFPEKVYIVGTDTNMYIFDAQENAMWMKFNEAGSALTSVNILSGTNGAAKSVYALDGKIYVGGNGSAVNYPLISINMISDSTKRYAVAGTYTWPSTIANRNSSQNYGSASGVTLVNDIINDIHAAVVNGKTFVALGTDAGVTLINETDATKVNFTRAGYAAGQGPVFISNDGTLYINGLVTATTVDNLFAFYNANLITVNQDYAAANWASSSSTSVIPPWLGGVQGTTQYNSLYVTQGTSTIDGKSNTIYLGKSNHGVAVINEKQGDESNGSVKFITKDFTSEEMIGDIRGSWSMTLDGSDALIGTSTIGSGTLIGDSSQKNGDLQAASTIDVLADGVRNKALTFDGTNDYLIQNPLTNYIETNQNGSDTLRFNATYQQIAQGFKIPENSSIGYIQLYLFRTGSPTGNIWAEIQTDNAGVPSNTIVTNGVSSNINVTTITTSSSGQWVAFRFPTSVVLNAGTQYHIVLKGDYTLSTTNIINWLGDNTAPTYTDGLGNIYNGTSWALSARDYIFKVFSANSNYNFTTAFTTGAWIKMPAAANTRPIISKYHNGVHAAYRLYITLTGLPVGHIDVSPFIVTGTTNVTDNNWHHIVHTFDGDTSKIYVDGVLEGSIIIRGSVPNINLPLLVGADMSNGLMGNLFNGSMDELFITSETLTYDQIKNIYETGKRAMEAGGINTFNGNSNQVNAAIASGFSKFVNAEGSANTIPSKLFIGTEGGGVSEFDLGSDTLRNFWTSGTTPAINHSNINALSVSTGGNFLAALDSGMSRVNDVSSRNELDSTVDTTVRGVFDKTDGYYKLYEGGTEVGRTYVTTSHTPVADTTNTTLSIGAKHTALYPDYFFDGKIKDINIWKRDLTGTFERIIVSDPTFSNWGDLVLQQTKPAGTDIVYTIYPYTAGSCNHGTVLFGPSSISGSTNISGINPVYEDICVFATLTTNDYKVLPAIDFMSATYTAAAKDTFKFNVRTDASRGSEVRVTNTIQVNSMVLDTQSSNNTYVDNIGFDIPSPDLDIDKDGYSCGTAGECTLENGLLAKWKFNKDTLDSSGNGRNGTLVNATESVYTSGKKDEGIKLDGINDYVELGSTSITGNYDVMSVSMWLKGSIDNSIRFAFDIGKDTGGLGKRLSIYNTGGALGANVEGTCDTSYPGGWGYNQSWHNVVFTFEKNVSCKLYVDGVLISTDSTVANTTLDLSSNDGEKIGTRYAGATAYWNGSIDETRVYNRVLTASEAKELAAQVSQSEYIEYTVDYLNRSSDFANGFEIVDKIPQGTCYKVDSLESSLPFGTEVLYSTDDVPTFATNPPYSPQPNGDGVDCNITAFKARPQSFNGGMVGYWKMDELVANSCIGGVNDACEASGNGLNGALNGNAAGTATSKFGRAVDFDGTGDYIQTANHASLTLTSNFTISTWVNADALTNEAIVCKGGSSGDPDYLLLLGRTGAASNSMSFYDGTSWRDSDANAISGTGVWAHVVVTYDGTNYQYYVNGQNVKSFTSSGSIQTSTNPLYFGIQCNAASNALDGRMDDTRIYNRVLTANEVNQLYSWTPSTLITHIKLDENTGGNGGSIYDTSYNGTNGAISTGDGVTNKWTAGKYGKAYNFDGINDFINFGDTTLLDGASTVSFGGWMYPTSYGPGTAAGDIRSVFSKGNYNGQATNTIFSFFQGNGAGGNNFNCGVDANLPVGLSVIVSAQTYIPLNQWTHYMCTWTSGSTLKLYINGKYIAQSAVSTAGTLVNVAHTLRLGSSHYASEDYFAGKLDDFRIYRAGLSATEVSNIYANALDKIKFQVKVNENIANQTNGVITNIADTELTQSAEVVTNNNSSKNELAIVYPSDIGGRVWNDRNGNGIQDASEEGVNGITVSLYNDNDANGVADGGAIATAVSANDYQTEWEYQGTTTNLMTNPSFETNTTGWSVVNGGTWTREQISNCIDSYCIKGITANASQSYVSTVSGLTPGSVVTVSMYMRATSGSAQFYVSDSGFVNGVNSSPVNVNTLTRQSVQKTVAGNGTIILVAYTPIAGTSYWDGVQIEVNPTVTTYCDGAVNAFGNQQWNGTAHAATSTCDYGNTTQTVSVLETGKYRFKDVNPANKYLVGVSDPAEYNITLQYAGGQDIDNNINPSTTKSGTILINNNQIKDNIDIGLKGNMSISGYIWEDLDNSGTRDTENATRQGMKGVTLKLYEDTDNNQAFGTVDRFIIEKQSGTNGTYNFSGMMPGKYLVVVAQSSFEQGQPLHGCISSDGNYPAVADYGKYLGDNVVSNQVNLSPGVPPDNGGLSYLNINFGFLEGAKSDSSSSWLTGWNYRKPIVISGNGSALTNHQVLITTDSKSLIDSGKMLSDCRDIRITDSDQTTLLSHWIESDCNTNRVRVWTKVPSIPTTAKTIYMYYGKEDATSTANGTNTFDFFDDFNDNSINTTKWQMNLGSWLETGGLLKQTSSVSADPKKAIMKSAPTADNYIVSSKVRVDGGASSLERAGVGLKTTLANGTGYNYVFNNFTTKNTLAFLNDGVAWSGNHTYIWSTNQWYRMDLVTNGTTLYSKKWRVGVAVPTTWDNSQVWSGRTGYPSLNGGSFDGLVSFDDAYVRKYASPDATTTSGTEQTKSYIAYWNLNENTGTSAKDSSSNTLNGTLTNGPTWIAGKKGSAVNFDGVNDHIVVPDTTSSPLDIGSGHFTVMAWIKANTINSARHDIVTKTSSFEFTIHTDNTLRIKFFGLTDNFISGSAPVLTTGTWYHVAATYNGTDMKTYVNGTLQVTDDSEGGSVTVNNNSLFIGTNSASNTTPFAGIIDDVRLYNYARSSAQIIDDMNGKTP